MIRRRALWVFALVASVLSLAAAAFAVQAFSGGTREIPVPSVESGALAHLAAADASAASWRGDAYLARVFATEGKPLDARVDPPLLYDTTPDPLVGNGLAVVWTFAYASPAEPGTLYFVSVGGDGGILYQRAITDPSACCVAYAVSSDGTVHSSGMPAPAKLARPALDAPDAFARVADRPEFADFSADHPVFQAFLHLSPAEGDHPSVWHVMYRTATMYGAYAMVDAQSGDVLEAGAWPRVEPPCCVEPPIVDPPAPPACCRPDDFREEYRMSLGMTRGSDHVNFPVESAAWLREMTVTVVPEAALPFDEVQVRLTDGQGRSLARETGSGPMTFTFDAVPGEGIYTVQAWTSTLAVREIPVTVVVDVAYADAASLPPAVHRFEDAVAPTGSESYFPLWFGWESRATRLSLTWSPTLPTDALEIVLYDEYGNDVATVTDATGGAELEVPDGATQCCLTAIVRNAGRGFAEQPFELLVEVSPPEPIVAVMAVHGDHAHGEHPEHGAHEH